MGDDKDSRVDKFEKRRKTTKSITLLLILGAILIVVLLFIWIFGGSNKNTETLNEASNEIQRDEDDSNNRIIEDNRNSNEEDEELSDENAEDETEEEESDKENEDVKTEQVESTDDNVSEAYTGDWKPVGTEQSEPHTTNYDEGSQDRAEMEKAIQSVTGLDNMILWWIGNGGDQKVIATVSPTDKSKTYRVYLSWIEGDGWQPTKVEELIKNDKN